MPKTDIKYKITFFNEYNESTTLSEEELAEYINSLIDRLKEKRYSQEEIEKAINSVCSLKCLRKKLGLNSKNMSRYSKNMRKE
jgi:hypothetical protein